jgi:hypothetical protein
MMCCLMLSLCVEAAWCADYIDYLWSDHLDWGVGRTVCALLMWC